MRKHISFVLKKNIIIILFVFVAVGADIILISQGIVKIPGLTPQPQIDNDNQVLQKGNVTIYFIDAGVGDSIFVDTPDKDVLIDGHEKSDGLEITAFLFSLNVTKIDYLVASHPHFDHIGGLVTVMTEFSSLDIPIHNVIDNGQKSDTNIYDEYTLLAEPIGITVAERNQVFQLDSQTEMIIISPPNPQIFSDGNENSIVLMIRFEDVSFLLTGDIETNSEKELVASGLDIDATILKVGHHGSKTSSTEAFLLKVTPEVAVINVGTENPNGHPDIETIERLDDLGIETYRTDLQGTISITTDGLHYTVTTNG